MEPILHNIFQSDGPEPKRDGCLPLGISDESNSKHDLSNRTPQSSPASTYVGYNSIGGL